MRRFTFGVASLFAVLAAAPAAGQTKPIQDEIDRKLTKARAAGRMDEHIEIFRRLLNRGVSEAYGFPTVLSAGVCPGCLPGALRPFQGRDANFLYSLEYSEGGKEVVESQYPFPFRSARNIAPGNASLTFPLAEGVYMKNTGVVYTLTLPAPDRHPLATAEKPTDKPLSPWERERRELRGEKAETPKKADGGPPSVSETILRLLAENGKHFTELAPDEHVTVAVVFRPGKWFTNQQCATCHQTSAGPMKGIQFLEPLFQNQSTGHPGTSPASGTSGKAGPMNLAVSVVATFRNETALADLHLKQQNPREAAKGYRTLIEKCVNRLAELEKLADEGAGVERVHVVKTGMELYGKLAQAHVEAGDNDTVLKTLKDWEAFSHKFVQLAAPKTGTGAPPPNPVPAKLVISVSKRVLDRFGTGEMRLDEFRKAATIEYTGAETEKDTKP